MFDHIVYVTAAYSVTAVVLAWCAFAPILKARKARAQLARFHMRDRTDKRQ